MIFFFHLRLPLNYICIRLWNINIVYYNIILGFGLFSFDFNFIINYLFIFNLF